MDYELNYYLQNVVPERLLRDRLNPLEFYSIAEGKKLFRYEPRNIIYIANCLENDLLRSSSRNKSLLPIQQVAIALRFYATGAMQLSLPFKKTTFSSLISFKNTVSICSFILFLFGQ